MYVCILGVESGRGKKKGRVVDFLLPPISNQRISKTSKLQSIAVAQVLTKYDSSVLYLFLLSPFLPLIVRSTRLVRVACLRHWKTGGLRNKWLGWPENWWIGVGRMPAQALPPMEICTMEVWALTICYMSTVNKFIEQRHHRPLHLHPLHHHYEILVPQVLERKAATVLPFIGANDPCNKPAMAPNKPFKMYRRIIDRAMV